MKTTAKIKNISLEEEPVPHGGNNQPKECYGPKFSMQKLNYIHSNPVEAGIVDKPENYLYSSAKGLYYGKKIGLLEIEFL